MSLLCHDVMVWRQGCSLMCLSLSFSLCVLAYHLTIHLFCFDLWIQPFSVFSCSLSKGVTLQQCCCMWSSSCGVFVKVLRHWCAPVLIQQSSSQRADQTGCTKFTACVSSSWQSSSLSQHPCLCSIGWYAHYVFDLTLGESKLWPQHTNTFFLFIQS